MNNISSGASAPEEQIKYRVRNFREISKVAKPAAFAVEGVIPEGIGIIAGSGGIGKTSIIVPLALAVAGISAPACDLLVKRPRKVMYLTEDFEQVENVLQGMGHFLEWNDETWEKVRSNFLPMDSIRMNQLEIRELLYQADCMKEMVEGFLVPSKPLIVLDTASANLNIDNEIDNSEVSRVMTYFKEWREKDAKQNSVWISAHLAKTAKGESIDEVINLGARGAGAWEDNSNWSAYVGASEKNGEGFRVFKMGKRRTVLDFEEIHAKGHIGYMPGNENGETIEVKYRYTVCERGGANLRKQEFAQREGEVMKKRFIDAFSNCKIEFPNKSAILALVNGNASKKKEFLDGMISSGEVIERPTPERNIKEYQRSKTYLSLKDNT